MQVDAAFAGPNTLHAGLATRIGKLGGGDLKFGLGAAGCDIGLVIQEEANELVIIGVNVLVLRGWCRGRARCWWSGCRRCCRGV